MSFTEWSNARRQNQVTQAVPSASNRQTSTPKRNSTQKLSFADWSDQQQAATTPDAWVQSTNNLLTEAQQYYSSWHDDEEERYANFQERSSNLLALADGWRKQYEGDNETISYINSVVSSLEGLQNYVADYHNYYSGWESEEDYNAAVRQYGYQQTYQGKSYDEIQTLLGQMEDGEEKDWLTEYGRSSEVMNSDVYQRLVSEKQAEVEALKQAKDAALQQATSNYHIYGDYDITEYNQIKAELEQAERELEELQAGQWSSDNAEKYSAISQAPDFKAVSAQVSEDPTTVFGLNFGDKFLGWGDPVYDYINDIDGNRESVRMSSNGNVSADASLYKYTFMDNTEIATYNYIYNTEGKKAANEYLNYLSYDLDARVQQEVAANNAEFATDHPVLSSIYSVPANLMSGVGLVDVAAQNAIKGVKEAVTGEYAGPINYNSAAMTPNTISTSIRGTVAKNITDATGAIQIKPEEHPFWSKVLNGKSWGDVYQLGMSMADSTAVALLYPVLGSAGTVLLGGSAGTQGVLDALENGATDGQALTMGILNGAFEMLFEKIPLENLWKGSSKNMITAILKQGVFEGLEEVGTTFSNTIADLIVMSENAAYRKQIEALKEQGLSDSEAFWSVMGDFAVQMGWDFVGGMISGGLMEVASAPIVNTQQRNAEAKAMYGDYAGELVGEALELSPDSNFAHRMQGRLDAGKDLTGSQLNRLVQKNEKAILQQDLSSIEQAAVSRLQELGETGDVEAIAKALAKRASGKKLSNRENQLIQDSKYGRRLSNELNPENIRTGEYSTNWAQQLNTNRINPEEYSSYVEAAQQPQETAETTMDKVAPKMPNVAQAVTQQAPAATVQENRTVADNTTVQKPAQTAEESSEAPAETVTLEKASEKYGAQAQAMIHTYTAGQDVAKYDAAYQAAYDMGRSGVNVSYAMKSNATSYLTESQRALAYEAGAAASNTDAQTQDAQNKAAANGKTGRKTGGVVRGEGVTMRDLRTALNDSRGTAYKSLSTIAKVTGINIVLYKSETDADGNFVGAQGEYRRKSDPGTIYIDINAGLENLKDVGDLEKYTVLRTFGHEFTHFIERWNPIQYNEFRKVVFDTLTERGQDVEFLIEQKQSAGLSYDDASREVVAEAMTDILPDANFVQELAEKHKTIFQKLLEKLKEFAANLRTYFNSLGTNRSSEANALKEQVGDTVKYLDSIVKLFDQVAVQAVENYQQTVARDVVVAKNATTETVVETSAAKVETVVEETSAEVEEKPVETKEPVTETDPHGFTITDNIERGSLEISFEGKPSEQVRDALKEHKFRWNGKKKVWYGYGDRAAIVDALHAAYEAETKHSESAIEPKPVVKNQVLGLPVVENIPASAVGGIVWNADDVITKTESDYTYKTIDAVIVGSDVYFRFRGTYKTNPQKQVFFVIRHFKDYTANEIFTDLINRSKGSNPYPLGRHFEAVVRTIWKNEGLSQGSHVKSIRDVEETTAPKPEQSGFEKSFRNATQAERDEVVAAITENTNITHMAPTEIREDVPEQTSEEVTPNGESETGTDARTVHEPVRGSEGSARLLEGVEPEAVQGSDEGRQPVQSGSDQGAADAGRDRRADAAGDVLPRSTRDRVGGDLQQLQDVTEDAADTNVGDKTAEDKPGSTDPVKLHEIVVDMTAQRSTENPKGSNFVIGDSLNLPNGTKARTRANIEAIRLVKQIAAEGRIATPAEQEILSKYVGWGGLADAFGKPVSNRETRKIEYEAVKGLEAEFEELKTVLTEEEYKSARESTKNAHYTSIEVIKAMYDGLKHLGFTGGRMLEPSSGVGNFVGAMPTDMTSQVKSWTMVELDHITGLFAKYLYPNADVRIQGFEEANIPDGYMDVAIGNVPFGNYAISDKHYPKAVTSAIHNYFFAKSLDKVRTGGIVMFITSAYTMNSRDSAVRKYIAQRADLLGAIRLPNTAFAGNAGTSVVTDILILKKRADRTAYEGEAFESSDWERLSTVGWDGAYVNEYFIKHPEMVLGTPKLARGMYSSNELTYDPFTDKGSLGDQIRDAMQHIQGKMDYAVQLSAEKANFRQASAKKKAQKLVVKDGVIHSKDNDGNITKVDVDKDTAARITGMVAIRDAHVALCDALQQGVTKKEINALRKALNKAYDAFVEKYGYLNAPKNKKAINSFADRYAILSLENYSTEGKKVTATKTDIFTKDTIAANRTATSAENVEEGLTISLNATGMVDVSMIARLTGQQPDSVTRQLIDQRLVFKDKDGNLIPAAQYLSGNVRAKLREMEGLTGIDSDYNYNVEALREVVPPTVQHTDIYVNPGANWVPVEVYESFVGYILKRSNYANYRTGKKDFSVEYVPETNEYKVAINDAYAKMSAQNTQVWGEGGKAFSTIFENMLNGRRTNVYMEGPDGNRVLDKAKTEAVAEKVEKLNEEFRKWIWEDETRRAEMQELYNETYNALVTPKYSGASLTVNGLNSTYDLRPHQKDAVARIINSGGNTLLAHRVGAGKTMEMAAAAMKLKQLGVIKKPMFVVPNNVVAQWGKEFKDYFPAANILVVGDEDMTPAERMTTINKIKNNDYDAVILAATKFEKIQMTKAWRQKFYEEQIDSILFAINAEKESQGGKGFTVKQLETKRKQLEKKLKNLTDKAKDEDGAMFEDLGVDSLFVDEAHNYKNLEYSTRMNNVSGLGKADGSQRAFDLYTKVRYLQQLNGGRGVVFATATPVMNSMTEMYIMQKYLQPDTLKQLGIEHFDSWAKMFGEVVNALEIAPSGSGYRLKQTFSKFKNVKALQQLFRSFTDVLTDVPGLKIPKMKGGKVQIVQCEQGEFQKNYMAELAARAENVRNVDPSEDNMLKITSDGRKISYSQRMIDPSMPYEESGKIYKCCDNVYSVYQESNKTKGTQMIFCDMATPKGKAKTETETDTDEFGSVDMESAQLYDDIKSRLVQLGIPAKEIAFIHDAKNDKQKAELSEKMNNGTIRVLLGSTGKMGVGLNAQKKAVAIHHLDAPWRPGDIEQRDGRVFRQKNENEEAYKFVYVTKGSFDSRLWDILERKQKFINQVMNGEDVGNEIEDTGEVTLSAAEVKAVASDNPLIMEQVALEKEISKLQSLQQAHRAGVSRAEEKIIADRRSIAVLENLIANVQTDIQNRKPTYSKEKFAITIGKTNYSDKQEAGAALIAAAQAQAKEGEYTDIGSFAGFTLRVVKTKDGIEGMVAGAGSYKFKTYPLNPTFGINHLAAVVEGFEENLEHWSRNLSEAKNDLATQKQLAAEPFAQADKLKEKRARYNEVMYILNPPAEQNVAADDVQEQARHYDDEKQRKRRKQSRYSETETLFLSWANGSAPAGDLKRFIRFGTTHYYEKTESGFVELSRAQYNERSRFDAENAYGRAEREISEAANYNESTQRNELGYSDLDRNSGGTSAVSGQAIGEELRNDAARSVPGNGGRDSGDGQQQRRISPLTDREVLSLAASRVKVDDMTAAEKDALDIFQKRLVKLEDLQAQRAEQGRIYKEQQFGAKVDRAAAAQTLERMKTLEAHIQKASAEVLSVEEKTVLKRVLQKARTVVEQQEREHGQEILKRWRDRRNDAAAIKKYRDRLRGDVDELTNWILHPDNKSTVKHIPDALKETVIPFLSSINFMSKRSLTGGNHTQADKAFMEQMRRLAKVMENTADIDEMYSNYTDLPPDFMKNLRSFMDTAQSIVDSNSGDFIINQMTAEELAKLSKVVRTLKKYIMQMNRFHVNSMFQHVHEAGENSIDFLGQLKPAENTGGVSQFLLWQQMRPAYAFERFGEGGQAIYDGLRRGQATLAFNTKKIMEFSEKAYTTAEVKAWENQIKTIRLGPGKTVTMRVSQIMSLYELNKREQAKGHILGEGIRVATFKNGRQKISDVGQTLTPGELNMILKELTPRQKEVADKLQQFMEKQGGAWGNHVTVARFGEKQFGEEHYFPINSDGRHLSVDADEKPGAAALYALLNMGFTKQTQENAKNRIVVYSIFDVFSNHMASMAQYNAFALPVVDALKWFNYQRKSEPDENGYRAILGSVREQMDRAFGVPEESRPGSGRKGYAQNFVINIIKAFNGTEAQGTPYDGLGMQTLHQYNRAQVAYNLRVVMQQPLAITRAAMLVDYASIIKGMKLNPAAIQKNIREMREYSGIAAWKALGFYDVNISRGLTSIIKHDDTALDKIADVGMWGAEKADTMTWAAIWSAAKEEVKRKQHLYPKDAGYYEAVTKLFEDIIYKTQVVDSVLTKNEFMRDKGFFARAVGSFMSEPTTTASMLVDAFDKHHMDMQRGMTRQQAWKKNGKRIVRTVYVYGLGAVILAAVQAVADAFRDDDDYQTYMEKWLEAFGGNLVDELMPFNKLPIVSDFYELAKELLAKLGVDTYGNPPQSVFMQWYDSLVKGVEILHDRIAGEDTNYTWYGGAYKLLQAISGMTGLPMAGATREIVTAWNNIVGAMAPSLKIKTYEPSEMAQIKYAYEDGYLTDDEAIAELIEQGLVDTDAEAYWTVQGWEAGEGYSRYDEILDIVRNGGDINAAMGELTSHGYKAKDVLSHIKSEIGAWYRKGKITRQQAEQMLTKYFDLNSKEVAETVNKWSSVVVTGIEYDDIKQEFIDGNISAQRAIEMRMRYGGETQKKATETVTQWRSEKETGIAYDDIQQEFVDGNITAQMAIEMRMLYGGYTQEEATETVTQWSAEKDTGIAYDDLKQEFIDGNITAQRAIEMRMRYGGYTQEEATETVTQWGAEKDTGIAYDDIDDAFMDGEISEGTARNMYVTYGGYSQEEASEKVAVLAFVKKHPDAEGISYAAIEGYTEYAEAAGVPVKTFYDAWKYNSNTDADVDANGKSISGSKKAKVLAYINNLNLTYAQKDALYYAFGWAESKIYEAPWH